MEETAMIRIATWMVCCLLVATGGVWAADGLFPFSVPDDDVSGGLTDMSFLNERPAGDLVTVRDGHFWAGERPIRFWGVNMCFSANYPTHEQAPMVARRLAKLGVNMVRITHTDTFPAPTGLLDAKHPGELRLDPERLERLDFFIAELKKRGIYVELSVNVSHLPQMGKLGVPMFDEGRFAFSAGVPLWNEKFIAAEKDFARRLIGHVNAYTGKPYTVEPAVAFVEILNENGILCAWRENHVRNTWSAALRADLQKSWNAFLAAKYQTTDRLRQAWAGKGSSQSKMALPSGESLEAKNVALLTTPGDAAGRTDAAAADFVDFLYQADREYFATLYNFLKKDLGCVHPIKGTQLEHYSSIFSQAQCDFADTHFYWHHPYFPHKAWDGRDWVINNVPMVNHFGGYAANDAVALVDVAAWRVRGKPFNISEYCHPAPNTYCAEELPMLASFAAMQGWDGIALFNYSGGGYTADRIINFFDRIGHPVKLVTMPFGALAFRRNDVAVGREESLVGVTLAEEKQWQLTGYSKKSTWSFPISADKGVTWRDVVAHRICLSPDTQDVPKRLSSQLTAVTSDTGQLTYDATKPDACVLTVNAPRAKAVIGFGSARTFDLGGLVVQPGPTMQAGFSVITASVVKGNDFRSPGASVLLTATGYVENTGMKWNAQKTSVSDQWGHGPVLCEGVPLAVVFPTKSIRAWALDGRGQRMKQIPTEPADGGARVRLGPQYKTLWYEVVVE
jgi:hypothetical protein